MIGLATSRRSSVSVAAPAGQLDAPAGGRGRDVDAELAGGVAHGVGGAVGHTGVQRDLDAVAVGDVPRAGLQQRIGEERAERVAGGGVEVALDEDDVGDADRPVERARRATRRRRRWPLTWGLRPATGP